MVTLEIGKVCIKTVGRESGKYCVVLKKIDKSFVMVTGPKLLTGVKKRKVNNSHLQPTEYKLEISEDANDETVLEAYKKAGLISKLNLKKPSIAQMKGESEKISKKVEATEKSEKENKKFEKNSKKKEKQ